MGGESSSGANEGNIDFRDGSNWGQTRQGELPSYEKDFGGEGNTGSMPASAWKNQPTEAIGGVGFGGNSIAKRVDSATGESTYGSSYNPGRMIGGAAGALLGGFPGAVIGSMLGGKTAETRFNFSDTGSSEEASYEAADEDSNLDDDRTAARQEASQGASQGASQPTSRPPTTVTSPYVPLTAWQRRRRALARSPVSTTEILLGA